MFNIFKKERKIWKAAFEIKALIRGLQFRYHLLVNAKKICDYEEFENSLFFFETMLKQLIRKLGYQKSDKIMKEHFNER